MEPGVSIASSAVLQAGGAPEQVVELLSDNYKAVAQTANLMAEWLIQAGTQNVELCIHVEKFTSLLQV